LTEDGLQQIINLRASMNLGLSDLQKSKFPNYNPVARPIISSTEVQILIELQGLQAVKVASL